VSGSSFQLEKEKKFEGGFKKSIFETLMMCYAPFKYRLIWVLTLGILGRLLALSNTNLVGLWVDSLTASSVQFSWMSDWAATDFLYALLLITVLGFIFTTLFRVAFSRLSARAVSTLYDETTYRVSRAPMSFFDQNPLGRIMTRFSSDYGNIFRLFGGPLAEFFSILFDLIAFMILMTFVHPSFFLLMAVYGASNWLIYHLNRDRLRASRRDLSQQRGPSIAHFAETAQGAINIRLFEKEKLFNQHFTELDSDYLKSKNKTFVQVISYIFQMNALSTFWFLLVGLYSVWGLKTGFLTVGDVGSALGLIIISFNSIQMFFEWLTQLEEGFVGVERMDDYLRRPLEKFSQLPSKALYKTQHQFEDLNFKSTVNSNFNIEIKNLSFKYNKDQDWILNNLSLTIPEKQRIGIVGRTGCGKSTLLQCLTYLYPFEGEISIGDLNPCEGSNLKDFRSQIAYLPQEPVVLKATLRENLDLKKLHTDSEMIECLKTVGLGPWFKSIGSELNFDLQEKGKNLSIGEKQLLGLARCILQDSPILILDEATSALDPVTEKIVLNVLENEAKNKTLIFVAHRLQTLHFCDSILWLENGKIKMQGPPKNLLSQFEIRDKFELN
jgi:ABC-type multidrug transport system fused ATPase/permease subunit